MLKFVNANNKLAGLAKMVGGKIISLPLLSGYSCPFAKTCLAKVLEDGQGKRTVWDGPDMETRCYSVSGEARLNNVYNLHKANWRALVDCGNNLDNLRSLLMSALPKKFDYVRIHTDGDFFTKNYFMAWLEVCKLHPSKVFYAYTKSIPFWVFAKDRGLMPDNLIMTASYGGTHDHLIEPNGLRYCKIVESVEQAGELGLVVDEFDSQAALPSLRNVNFALLIHGAQPAGSKWGKAVRKLKGKGSYGPKTTTVKV